MEKRKSTRRLLLITLMVIVAFTFSISQVCAASKSVKLIKEDGWKYNKNGLIEKTMMYDIISVFKYDKKGNITKVSRYFQHTKKKNHINDFKFKYDKKGKLKEVKFVYYTEGKVTQKSVGTFKLDKKKRLTQLRIETYGMSDREYKWKYNKKGQVKELRWIGYEAGRMMDKVIMKVSRKSGGIVTATNTSGYYDVNDHKYDFTMKDTYKTKKKGGYIKKIKVKTSNGDMEEHVYSYKAKKIPSKYVKQVKAQQLDLCYLMFTDGWNFVNPYFYLAV